MKYGTELDEIIEQSLKELIEWKKEKKGPFAENVVEKYYKEYIEMQKNSEK